MSSSSGSSNDSTTIATRFPLLVQAVCEFIGTAVLVLFGCGSAVLTPSISNSYLQISFAFGIAIISMAYAIGDISGCHINPAVTLSVLVAGRDKAMDAKKFIAYVVAQFVGAIVGALLLLVISSGRDDFDSSKLGQNGWGPGYLGAYTMGAAFLFEVLFTFIFTFVILGSTQGSANETAQAGNTIGMTLVAIHIVGIHVTGVSVNPARSLGPALLGNDSARLEQVWLFIVAPLIGAVLAGIMFRFKIFHIAEKHD